MCSRFLKKERGGDGSFRCALYVRIQGTIRTRVVQNCGGTIFNLEETFDNIRVILNVKTLFANKTSCISFLDKMYFNHFPIEALVSHDGV